MIPIFSVVAAANSPPTEPEISGTQNGDAGVRYDYGICSTDPDGDEIIYCIDWGDDTGEVCIGPFPSGTCITESHTWTSAGTFTIRVKAGDGELESDYTEYPVTMPRSRLISNIIMFRMFERFPNAFPIFRYFLGL
jgi:hypothetical protein